jgi:hypothetical protein
VPELDYALAVYGTDTSAAPGDGSVERLRAHHKPGRILPGKDPHCAEERLGREEKVGEQDVGTSLRVSRVDAPLTLVTGGSRGIGVATVVALAHAGHDVAFRYRSDRDSSQRVRTRVMEMGRLCLSVQADLTQEPAVSDLFAKAAAFGRITGLVNDAGLTEHVGDLIDTLQK